MYNTVSGSPDPTKSVCIQKRQLTPPWQRRNSGRGDGALLRFPSRRRRAYLPARKLHTKSCLLSELFRLLRLAGPAMSLPDPSAV